MTRETFPKVKKGDIVTDGRKAYLVLRLKNTPDFDSHGHHVGWINGFLYLDSDGFEKFQEYNSKDFTLVGRSKAFETFLKEYRKEVRALVKPDYSIL